MSGLIAERENVGGAGCSKRPAPLRNPDRVIRRDAGKTQLLIVGARREPEFQSNGRTDRRPSRSGKRLVYYDFRLEWIGVLLLVGRSQGPIDRSFCEAYGHAD
jgi:hypothetical protein